MTGAAPDPTPDEPTPVAAASRSSTAAPPAGRRPLPRDAAGPDADRRSPTAREPVAGAAGAPTGRAAPSDERQHLEHSIRDSLEHYFRDLGGVEPAAMYDMILGVVEKPLLDVVMRHAGQNQSRAAQWLGINRNTLRRKLVLHKLAE